MGRIALLAGNLDICHPCLDGVDGVRNVVDQELDGFARRGKIVRWSFDHAVEVGVVVVQNIAHDLVFGSSSNHELQQGRPKIDDIVRSIERRGELVGNFMEATVRMCDVLEFLEVGGILGPKNCLLPIGKLRLECLVVASFEFVDEDIAIVPVWVGQ